MILLLRSQKIRKQGAEIDALRMGMDWTADDLDKMQIIIANTYGNGHPGSFHLDKYVSTLKNELKKIDVMGSLIFWMKVGVWNNALVIFRNIVFICINRNSGCFCTWIIKYCFNESYGFTVYGFAI